MNKTQDEHDQTGKPRKGKPRFIDTPRREFIQRSAVLGGVVGGGLGAGAQADTIPEPIQTESDSRADAGYQLTDKIREYYRKARF